MEAAVQHGALVHEHRPLQRVGLDVEEPHRLEGASAHAGTPPQPNPTDQTEQRGFRFLEQAGGSRGLKLTLSHAETRRWSEFLEKRRLETPSFGGCASSLPIPMPPPPPPSTGGWPAAGALMAGSRGSRRRRLAGGGRAPG